MVLTFLLLDLKYAKGVERSLRLAAAWAALWISLGLALSAYIYEFYGPEEFVKYIAAYATEKLLSVDNLFVFLAIFTCAAGEEAPPAERTDITGLGSWSNLRGRCSPPSSWPSSP